MTRKPRMFIGSSVESLRTAFSVQEEVEHDIESTVWTQGIFEPSSTTMTSLLKAVKNFDMAVFVFAPDDVVRIRDEQFRVARDNVVFEMGLFVGAVGLEHVFFVIPRTEGLRIPSDLLGVTPLSFDPERSDGNLRASLGPACNKIREHANVHFRRQRPAGTPGVSPDDLEERASATGTSPAAGPPQVEGRSRRLQDQAEEELESM